MKLWLPASLLLNLALGVLSGLLLTQNPPETEATPIQPLQVKPGIKLAPAPKSFQWSQLESEDFPVYVANLRAIGCPEATIHDIVAGEMKEIYDEKRRAVTAKAATRRAIEAEQEKLAQEENAVVARTLGSSSVASSGTSGGSEPAIARKPRIVYPTVFQNPGVLYSQNKGSSAVPNKSGRQGAVAASEPVLTPNHVQAVEQLQQQFVQDVGGPNQNPVDPAYLKRWQKAQQESDDSLRVQIGWSAFSAYQVALAQQAEAAVSSGK